jgi:hypothetical protein
MSPAPAAAPAISDHTAVSVSRLGVGAAATGIGIAICVALTALSHWALSVDGVSYLDLARTARSGEWQAFIQGYWSPLYPATIAMLSMVTDGSPTSLVLLGHIVNGAAAIAAIALLWWWGRQVARPYFTPALLAVFLLASAGLPRIEAVTPDVLLLAMMSWVGYELLHHKGGRPIATGVALGLSFLVKTSVWPWLLVSIPFRLWSAEGPAGRRGVVLSSGIALLLACLWIVPLSLKEDRFTVGSAGRLNYGWYIEGSDSRTPDTHLGRHQAARLIAIDSARGVEVLFFANADRWTYAPWSDPTDWSAGVRTSSARAPKLSQLLAYWGRQASYTFGFLILPVLLGVLVPCAIAFGIRGSAARLVRGERARLTTLLLGITGILQFVAVHSEPRLIAPFILLVGAAVLDTIFSNDEGATHGTVRARSAISVAWAMVALLSSVRLSTGVTAGARSQAAAARITADQARAALNDPLGRGILVAGPALPVVPAAFIAGVRIAAQLPPRSLLLAQTLPPAQQDSLLREAAAGRVATAWITDPNGGVSVVPIPDP